MDVKYMRTLLPIYSACRAKMNITYLETMTPFYALHIINYTHNCVVCILMIVFIEHYFPLSSRPTALLWHVILSECCLVVTWLVTHETAAVSAQVMCTPYNHVPCRIASNKATYVKCRRV